MMRPVVDRLWSLVLRWGRALWRGARVQQEQTWSFTLVVALVFAAMQIGMILELKERPTEFWTATDWACLRRRVREALVKENLPDWAQ